MKGYIILWKDLQEQPLYTSLLLSVMAVNAGTQECSALGFTQEATLALLMWTVPASHVINICRMKQKSVQDLKTVWVDRFSKEIGLIHYKGLQIYFTIANDYECCSPSRESSRGENTGLGVPEPSQVPAKPVSAHYEGIRILRLLIAYLQCWQSQDLWVEETAKWEKGPVF